MTEAGPGDFGTDGKAPKIALVVGEESGDFLGAALMASLKAKLPGETQFCGVAGARMMAEGMTSLFDIADTSVMGLTAVLKRLPLIIRRVHETVDFVVSENPDVLIIIDSPDFTHAVAKRVRKRAPHIPIVGYVSPSVWAWRSGRARKMKAYVDELLALLPFEPGVHARLGGPRTHYVGHPLIERLDDLRPQVGERKDLSERKPVLLVLPGSRGSEIERLLPVFGETVAQIAAARPEVDFVLPAVAHLAERIEAQTQSWPVRPTIVRGEEAKQAAFRSANAALAASGTVTLQLAISGVPMVVAYKVDWFMRRIKDLNKVFPISSLTSFVLPNIILGRKLIPEFLDEEVTSERLAGETLKLLNDSPERRTQVSGLSELDKAMRLPDGKSQSEAAADVVLEVLGRDRAGQTYSS
ncbi:lipid-A-disaccharide synthase [Roseibium sp.]|uniref:lipid-A-disaccharide synthase n=1 Tax=Roseibium sp. TaxID=1936156 RepID=UPI003A975801